MSADIWHYLETEWLESVEVCIFNRDTEALVRRLRSMAEELSTRDIRQEILK